MWSNVFDGGCVKAVAEKIQVGKIASRRKVIGKMKGKEMAFPLFFKILLFTYRSVLLLKILRFYTWNRYRSSTPTAPATASKISYKQ